MLRGRAISALYNLLKQQTDFNSAPSASIPSSGHSVILFSCSFLYRFSNHCPKKSWGGGEQKHLDRAGQRLELWGGGAKGEASQQAVFLRQATADADWDTVERHGGLDAIVGKIDHADDESTASAGAGMIGNFRLAGSRTWRRMGGHLTKGGWRT